jgi:predicted DNA-binding protein (MmcQ/YjbR family)
VPAQIVRETRRIGPCWAIGRLGASGTIHHMTAAVLRDHCLSFLGSEETFPFGPETSVFKVAGRIFALSRLAETPLRVSLKCEPALAEQLRKAHAAVIPGYHLNKRHWNTVIIDGSLPKQMIRDMVEDSYDLIVSKLSRAQRRSLAWGGDA